MTILERPRRSAQPSPALLDTGRVTGLLYLAVGIAGVIGFLLIRTQLFQADEPSSTVVNLVENEGLARLGIAVDLVLVLAQSLTALWFYRLFRSVDAFAAAAIAVFGMVNAVAILASTAMTATALDLALSGAEGRAGDSHLMYLVSENLWGMGNLFFGLWLIPMGWCVLRSRTMPRPLGWILVAGGIGYVLSAFLGYLVPSAGLAAEALVIPATVGELWMIGYLLVRGDRCLTR
jgi:hypothetical protein